MNATWYDVLGIDEGASTEEVREAWKQTIADLEPGDRRFRAANQAAEVLLDPDRRAAYDAELTASAELEPEVAGEPEPVVGTTAPAFEPARDVVHRVEPVERRVPTKPTWLIAALAVATVVLGAVAVGIWFGTEPETDVEAKVVEARSAAEQALPQLINYDYKTAERDMDQALRLTTGQAREELEKLWNDAILPNVEKAKASAKSTVVTSGVVRAADDGDRVQIVVVMDVQSQNAAVKNTDRLPFTVTMEETDGVWLVSEFSEGDAGPAPTESPTEGE